MKGAWHRYAIILLNRSVWVPHVWVLSRGMGPVIAQFQDHPLNLVLCFSFMDDPVLQYLGEWLTRRFLKQFYPELRSI